MPTIEIEVSYPLKTARIERKSLKVDPSTRQSRMLHHSVADILRDLIEKSYPIRHIYQTLPLQIFVDSGLCS